MRRNESNHSLVRTYINKCIAGFEESLNCQLRWKVGPATEKIRHAVGKITEVKPHLKPMQLTSLPADAFARPPWICVIRANRQCEYFAPSRQLPANIWPRKPNRGPVGHTGNIQHLTASPFFWELINRRLAQECQRVHGQPLFSHKPHSGLQGEAC